MAVKHSSISVVANPVGAEQQSELLAESLGARGVDATWYETTETDPGVGQAKRAVEAGADVVIACGGDGTVRACIESVAGSGTALAVVPAGTGNLLCRNLDLPDDATEAVALALGTGRRPLDVGVVNGEAFAVMAGAGFDAAVMRDTTREAKDTLGSLAYVATAFSHLRDPRFECTLDIDTHRIYEGNAATILAANFGKLQGGVDLFPDSNPADGDLDFMAINASTLGDWVKTALGVLTRSTVPGTVDRWTGTRAVMTFASPTPYQLDGDERPAATRLEFGVRRRALTICTRGDLA